MNATPQRFSAPRLRGALISCLATGVLLSGPAEAQTVPIGDLAVPTTGSTVQIGAAPGTLPPPASTVLGNDGDLFEITFDFAGLTPQQEEAFETAAAIWDLVITGYQADAALGGPLTFAGGATGPVISAGASTMDPPFDGAGGVLAVGGVGSVIAIDLVDPAETDFVLASDGFVFFDADDIGGLESAGLLLDVAVHEIGHVLGIGTLWDTSGIAFIDGTGAPVAINGQVVSVGGSGEYTGQAGLAAYQSEFDPAATTVPVELAGGPGTADAHWNENAPGEIPGVLPSSNEVSLSLSNEILTGFLGPQPTFLSTLTAQSLVDIGFTVDPTFQSATIADLAELVAIPEPTGAALLGALLLTAASHGRRS